MADGTIEQRIRRWERVIPGTHFSHIKAAARIVQLGNTLTTAMDHIARSEGLANQDDYQILAVLRTAQHDGRRLTLTDVANDVGSITATVVNRVDRLQRLEYLRRVPHPTDRRSVYLTVTPEGVACAHRIVLHRTEQREQWLAALTDDERNVLTDLLNKLADTPLPPAA